MTEVEKQTTIVSWRPDYDAERLMVSDWIDKDGWDFVGCVVDIQLRRADGDYFFVKYVGSVEGIDEDAIVAESLRQNEMGFDVYSLRYPGDSNTDDEVVGSLNLDSVDENEGSSNEWRDEKGT